MLLSLASMEQGHPGRLDGVVGVIPAIGGTATGWANPSPGRLQESVRQSACFFLQRPSKQWLEFRLTASPEYRFQHPMVRLYIWLSQFHGQQTEKLINDMAQRVGDLAAEEGGTAPL
jgi:hypothetical protein